jgi:hypothetical protein
MTMRPIQIGLTVSLILNLAFSNQAWSSTVIVGEQAPQSPGPTKMFRAGAHAMDIAPRVFPVLVNGGFLQNQASKLNDPIHAKAIVLDDDSLKLAIVVVDSCMMPRDLIDRAKELARQKTGIPTDRILVSATHTHSAPAAMGALGCPADDNYVQILPGMIAESVERAARNLEPARIGWSSINDRVHTYCRRFIRRPDKMLDDPFGQRTVRANMHPGYQSADVIGPSGPVDPELIVLSVQSRSGRPIAVLANYSMHYYGAEPVSADYYGRFAVALAKRLNTQALEPPFVGIMSQGTSGDQMWMDYDGPKKDLGLDAYAADIARVAHTAYQSIAYHDWVPLAMAETTLTLARRTPSPERLAWARKTVDQMQAQAKTKGKPPVPQGLPQVYAKEAIYLHEEPQRELKLQAIRVGGMGITAIPNEVFAITGLKLKMRSPFETTMNIELANGSEGYIPPPEQHRLGGYTTWPARTAGLEVQAEPRIVARILELLEQVAAKPLRGFSVHHGAYAQSILASRPHAYWRLDDIEGLTAVDSTGNGRNAAYEGGVALYLPGIARPGLSTAGSINRAVHFAGGRLTASLEGVGESYSVGLWFWNGLPTASRPITGHLLSFEALNGPAVANVGIGGTNTVPSRLFYSSGGASAKAMVGTTEITPKTWHHLALVRDRGRVSIYLDGKTEPEIFGQVVEGSKGGLKSLFVGGRENNLASFEGKIDEVAFFDRALGAHEIARHFGASLADTPSPPESRE